jgi:protein-tyrosine phosphatase
MMGFIKFFKSRREENTEIIPNVITTDIHSHLLPNLDDGSKSFEDSLEMIKAFQAMGYKKLITTPHVMADFYKNTAEIILKKLDELKNFLQKNNIEIEIEAAAEYYLDENLIRLLKNEAQILTFGDNYLLFETGFMNKPSQMNAVIFDMQSQGYKPVLAHPERYAYFYDDFEELEALHQKGVFMQLNLNSLTGYYSAEAQKQAELLIKKKMISFVGSDCHRMVHLDSLKTVRPKKIYTKLCELNLLNNSL